MKIKISISILLTVLSILLLNCTKESKIDVPHKSLYEHMVLSTLYSQIAAENKALQYQAFNVSKNLVKNHVESKGLKGNEAIIIDVDETILETSMFQVKMIVENLEFLKGWDAFINSASCKPINGAIEFLNFIDSLGISIFYVSNRNHQQIDALIKNLKAYNFPQVDEHNIYLKKNSSNKELRRQNILSKHNVLLLIGDSLEDFSDIFEANNNEDRIKKVQENNNLLGSKFIVLPNSSYGAWESIIYNHNWKLSFSVQDSLRKSTLKKILALYENDLVSN